MAATGAVEHEDCARREAVATKQRSVVGPSLRAHVVFGVRQADVLHAMRNEYAAPRRLVIAPPRAQLVEPADDGRVVLWPTDLGQTGVGFRDL